MGDGASVRCAGQGRAGRIRPAPRRTLRGQSSPGMRRLLAALLFPAAGLALAVPFTPKGPFSGGAAPVHPTASVAPDDTARYAAAWKRVAAFERDGKPRSALTLVDSIHAEAARRGDALVRTRAALVRARLTVATVPEDSAADRVFDALRAEVGAAQGLARPLLHSYLAETYALYFGEHRWQIAGRTETGEPRSERVATWTLRDLAGAAAREHRAALAALGDAAATPVSAIEYLLVDQDSLPNGRPLRPTLLDLVGHRALDFFADGDLASAFPEERFRLDEEVWFDAPEAFARAALVADADSSFEAEATRLFQRLTAAHLTGDAAPLLDVTLRRLDFARSHSTLTDRDARYEAALRRLLERYRSTPHSTLVALRLAEYLAHGRPVSVAPRPRFGVQAVHGGDGGGAPAVDRPQLREAIRVCEAAARQHPETPGARNCRSLVAGLRQPSAQVMVEAFVPPGVAMRAFVQYANVETLHLRVVPVTRDFQQRLGRVGSSRERERLLRELLAATPAEAARFALPGGLEVGGHSTEVPLAPRAVGTYVLLASADGRFEVRKDEDLPFAFFTVTRLAAVTRATGDGALELHVLDRETGAPVPGATVRVLVQRQGRFPEGQERGAETLALAPVTDAEGHVRLRPPRNTGYRVEVVKGNDVLDLGGMYVGEDGRPEAGPRVFFFTDRALYRPGQTVYVKGILLTTDGPAGHVLADTRVRVTFRDVNGQDIASELFTTNEFGSFSGAFVAPQGRLGGAMSLVAQYQNRDIGWQRVQVEEYRRPRFEVTFEDVAGQATFGEAVTVDGKAVSYAGVPLADAQVQYRVVRQPLWPWWWSWWRPAPRGEEEITNGVLRTDADGRFRVTFTPRPDPGDRPESGIAYRYRVLADVTDVSGETQSGATSLSVGFAALRAATVLPPVLDQARLPDTLRVVTENLNGTFEAARGSVRFALLRDPGRALRDRYWAAPDTQYLSRPDYVRRFPHDPYGDEADVNTWPVARVVADLAFDTGASRTIRLPAEAARWPEGMYRVTTTSRDARGRPVETVQTITITNSTTRTMPVPALVWAVPLTESARPGETARFLVGSSERGVRVRVDVEVDGRIVRSEWRTLDAEKQRIEVAVTEEMRGGFGVHVAAVRASRAFTQSFAVSVPTGRDLKLALATFRDRVRPGTEETWTLTVAGEDGERVAAEVVAAMYDASLDAILPHGWGFNPFHGRGLRRAWQAGGGFGAVGLSLHFPGPDMPGGGIAYDALDRFGFESFNPWQARYDRRLRLQAGVVAEEMAMAAPPPPPGAPVSVAPTAQAVPDAADGAAMNKAESEARERLAEVQARRNLNETAFFFPHLRTDAEGRVSFTFTMPEALTRWNLFAFAHTSDLRHGQTRAETVTQKDLMVTPNLPRFVREGDRLRLTARVDNRAGRALTGEAALLLFDAATMQPVDTLLGNTAAMRRFTLAADSSLALAWNVAVPADAAGQGSGAYVARVVAHTADFSDGEETLLPILTNRVLVTETLPLPIRGGQTRTYTLDKLLASGDDPSIQHYRLALEFTPNPAWYAVAALPYLMEYPYDCVEQVFSRFYANSLASHVASSDPRIREVFEQWRRADAAVLRSNLERNEELKAVLLEQTPWVQQAQDETERRRRIALLFDLARVGAELDRALARLEEMQRSSGAWPWFPGLPDDRYITGLVVAGMGRLDRLGVLTPAQKQRTDRMVAQAIRYLDAQLVRDLEELRRRRANLNEVVPSDLVVHYLYGRAFHNVRAEGEAAGALTYFRTRAAASWRGYRLYTQTLLALSLHRTAPAEGASDVPARILTSAREFARRSDELGMYWPEERGWFWYQAPIERQALLIEAFLEIARDAATAEEARIWLLKQKQVQDWRTTRATADAIYALLLGTPGQAGSRAIALLAETPAVTVRVGPETFDARRLRGVQEAGTGYFKQTWPGEAVQPAMGRVEVTHPGPSIAWGALYWQFFQPIERVTASQETPLRLTQALFVERRGPRGPVLEPLGEGAALRVGDRLVARLVLRVDRAMEYVHLQSLRASSLEPSEQLSGYRYQDGLGYYQTTRDASTDFFFGWLPTGTYVFEYGLRVRHAGSFAGALSRIQSMYAPEFSAHSAGARIVVAE
jgi:hypothetical protein